MNRFIRVGNAHYEEVVRVTHTIEETYGQVLLSQLFTHIWFGDWDEYEETVNQLPADLLKEFPFHQYYERKETEQWHDNYFSIPGIYFVPPYLSSYQGKSEKEEVQAKQDLLCLDRKSTRLNSSHVAISYAVFCLKKKKLTARI